jgi:hypothetical protein
MDFLEKRQGVLNLILTLFLVVANIALWITTRDAVREARQASQGNTVGSIKQGLLPRSKNVRNTKSD